jgi:anaerobic magnesium-protoporphyrin IX monomethyl ester cyclase
LNLVLLNPPNPQRIQRRFMCSYNAPNMLLPPHELIALGGVLRGLDHCNTYLVDAIAEQLNTSSTIDRLGSLNPDIIVSIQGFECFEEDMTVLEEIKKRIPAAKMILFGHYATLFANEILSNTNIDIVIFGEPDNIFGNLIEALLKDTGLQTVKGIAYKSEGSIVIQKGDERIPHPELLPMPAYELLKADKYFEPFLQGPFGLIQSARGCPYSCNYCVRSFGKRLAYRTTEQIIEEIIFLKKTFGIKSLRFIDDTFTVHAKRVIDICTKLIDLKIDIEWTCLSRVDTLTEEMIIWMKKSGCKRIYFGIESGSDKVLKYLNKNVNLKDALSTLHKCKAHGIETLGFFIVGAPVEEDEDFYASVNFAIEADFDYITASELIPYPGTDFYEAVKDEVNFTLFPYKNEWKSASLRARNKAREKEFYKRFYYRKKYFFKSASKVLNHPIQYLDNFRKLSNFLVIQKESRRSDFM